MTITAPAVADIARQLFEACATFERGIRPYFGDLEPAGERELSFLSVASIGAALLVSRPADGVVQTEFEKLLTSACGTPWIRAYRSRFAIYGPLLVENFRTVEPTGELATVVNRHVLGRASDSEGHSDAIANYCLVAIELVNSAFD